MSDNEQKPLSGAHSLTTGPTGTYGWSRRKPRPKPTKGAFGGKNKK